MQQHWRHFRGDALKSEHQQSHVRSWISNPRALSSWTRRRSRSVCGKPLSGFSPSLAGCTNEMLRVCFGRSRVAPTVVLASEDFAGGTVPPTLGRVLMVATMTALQKPEGGVRGSQLAWLSGGSWPSVWHDSLPTLWDQSVPHSSSLCPLEREQIAWATSSEPSPMPTLL